MKFIWEESDIGSPPGRLAIYSKGDSDEIVMVNESGITSLIDGHRWLTDNSAGNIAEYLTDMEYAPVTDAVTAHAAVRDRRI